MSETIRGAVRPVNKASYEVISLPTGHEPLRQQLTSLFNDYHEARAKGDTERMAQLDATIPVVLDEFERTESRNAENPAWLRRVKRAGWHCARGDEELALEYEMDGWRFANAEPKAGVAPETVARWKSISASNISDALRRLGRYEEAVVWGKVGCELWPSNPIKYLILALALYRVGEREDAERIFKELRKVAAAQDGKNALASCLLYERDLQEMTDLPSVRAMLDDLRAARQL
jgi:tetratricopeptide (TPR) repeat protein